MPHNISSITKPIRSCFNFVIKTTKSVILSEVVERSNKVSSFNNINEGELVRLNNVNLTLENEAELRAVKLFTSGAFKDMAIPGANGFRYRWADIIL